MTVATPIGISLLAIEDDPAYLQVIRSELEQDDSKHINCVQALRLSEGLEKLRQNSFDAVLLDLGLPDSQGTETFEMCRQAAPHLPIIVLSDNDNAEATTKVLRLGAQDCLYKANLNRHRLSESVRNAIERNRIAAELIYRRKELIRSEARFRSVIESSSDAMLIVDASGLIQFANPAAATMFGRSTEALVAQPFGFPIALNQATELDIRRTDGALGIAELRVESIEWDGQLASLATLRDITDRKRKDDAFRLFRDLVERTNDAFEVIDPATGHLLDMNEKDCLDLGYSRSELLELKIFDIYTTFRFEAWPTLLDTINVEGSVRGEGRHRRKDGSTFPVEFNIKLVLLDRPYLVNVVRDITERKKAEDRIRAQATLLDKTSDAIIVRDLNNTVQFWSKGAERVYGWSAPEVSGREISGKFIQPIVATNEAWDALHREGSWTGEICQVRKDGAEITVQCRWTLLRNSAGVPEGVLSIDTDVTEKKKIEAQLFRAQRMDSIGTMAGGIAHDLNNIFTPILLCMGTLKMDATDPTTIATLENIEASTKRGAHLVKQVLAFGRGVKGERTTVKPQIIADEVSQIIKETFPRSIYFSMKVEPGLWNITGDATQLHQILINLCVNARDAMPEGGSLILSLENSTIKESRRTEITEAMPGNYVLFKVTDTGTGIPADVRERIFEPFFTTKEIGRGTGLGLSTVMAITKSHGGFVEIQSEVGVGTAFLIYLPARVGSVTTPPIGGGKSLDQLRGQGELILLVDDNEIIRAVAGKILQRFGYRHLVAVNGADALSIYAKRAKEIDAVITDMNMPIMGGHATIAALRSINPSVRIIGSSGLNSSNGIVASNKASADRFIAKPYLAETLLGTLKELLTGRHNESRA